MFNIKDNSQALLPPNYPYFACHMRQIIRCNYIFFLLEINLKHFFRIILILLFMDFYFLLLKLYIIRLWWLTTLYLLSINISFSWISIFVGKENKLQSSVLIYSFPCHIINFIIKSYLSSTLISRLSYLNL